MPVRERRILTLWGDGIHDDTAALQALINGETVRRLDQVLKYYDVPEGKYLLSDTIALPHCTVIIGSRLIAKHAKPALLVVQSGAVLCDTELRRISDS
jgi:hypothetical protein